MEQPELAQDSHRPVTTREMALVLGLPTAVFLASSISWRVRHTGIVFTDRRLLMTLAIEMAIVAVLLPYLWRKGWRPAAVARTPEPRDVVRGLGLWLGLMGAVYLTVIVLYVAAPDYVRGLVQTRPFTGVVSAPVIVATALLNPIFEEFLWLGYTIPTLGSRFGIRTACVISIVLRVAVHLYQGTIALIAILPTAIVMTVYFARTRRLWPVVVAHVIVDAIGLSGFLPAT